MKKPVCTGAAVAIITTMHADGSVNYDELGRIIEDQIAHSTDAIVICGTTGESPTMTDEEHTECIRYAVKKVVGRVPVVAGTGSNDTKYAIWLSQQAEADGADALLLVTPYYNKASQAGLIAHYTAIADAVHLPCILYNVLQAVFALPYIGNRCARIPPQRQKTAVCLRDMQPRIGVVDRPGHKAEACFAVIVWRALRMVPSELHRCTLLGTFTDPFDKKWGRCPAAAPTAHKVYAILLLLILRPEQRPHQSGSASRPGSPDSRRPDTPGCTRHTWTQTGRGCR